MKINDLPFSITDWQTLEKTTHKGETGFAYWKTQEFGDIRISMVTYSSGYLDEDWCTKGHIIFCVSGELSIHLCDGSNHILTQGMSYQVADSKQSHRVSSVDGATLFIVD